MKSAQVFMASRPQAASENRVVEFNCLNCSSFYVATVDDLATVYGLVSKLLVPQAA